MSQPPVDSPRLYVGRLSHDVRTGDIEDLFQPYGRIVDVRLMGTFGFVELDSPRDAESAIKALHGQDLKGERLIVESAKPRPPRTDRDAYGPPRDRDTRDTRDQWGPGAPAPRRERAPLRRAQFRVLLSRLPPGLSWQAIKDLGRPHGTVVFADIDPQRDDEGIIEYNYRDEMDAAVRALDGFEYRGSRLRADPVETPPPASFGPAREERFATRGAYDRPPSTRYGGPTGPRSDRRPRPDDRYRPRSPPPSRRDNAQDYRSDWRGAADSGDGSSHVDGDGHGGDAVERARAREREHSPNRVHDGDYDDRRSRSRSPRRDRHLGRSEDGEDDRVRARAHVSDELAAEAQADESPFDSA